MSKQFRKYRFGSKGAYTTKANALPHIENEEGELVPSHSHIIVELGHEVTPQQHTMKKGNYSLMPYMVMRI